MDEDVIEGRVRRRMRLLDLAVDYASVSMHHH